MENLQSVPISLRIGLSEKVTTCLRGVSLNLRNCCFCTAAIAMNMVDRITSGHTVCVSGKEFLVNVRLCDWYWMD